MTNLFFNLKTVQTGTVVTKLKSEPEPKLFLKVGTGAVAGAETNVPQH
jgi:hypothetical protein